MKNLNPRKKDSKTFLKIESLIEKNAYGSESLNGGIFKLYKGSESLRNEFESIDLQMHLMLVKMAIYSKFQKIIVDT